ncbi:hypothetical protein J3459_009945 [Metarhizium acridum]|nr:hypothetical protein J3459_009945 [Metarhizium acridum]
MGYQVTVTEKNGGWQKRPGYHDLSGCVMGAKEAWNSGPPSPSFSSSFSFSSAAAADPLPFHLSNSSGRMNTAVKGDKGGYKLLINNNQGNYRKQLHASSGRRWLIPLISSSPPRCTGPASLQPHPPPACSQVALAFFNTFFFCRCFVSP